MIFTKNTLLAPHFPSILTHQKRPGVTVFISRNLSEAPDFQRLLVAEGWSVRGFSLLQLTPLPFVWPSERVDWVFFASSFGVRCFFNAASDSTPKSIQFAALGPATAAALRRFVHPVDFVGTGEPASTAAAFRPLATGKTVLFPAARHSRRSVPELLGDTIRVIHLPVYDNRPLPDPPRLDDDVLVLTSPLNARAYFSKHPLQPHQQVVAIGPTTAAALRELGVAEVVESAAPSAAALVAAVLHGRT